MKNKALVVLDIFIRLFGDHVDGEMDVMVTQDLGEVGAFIWGQVAQIDTFAQKWVGSVETLHLMGESRDDKPIVKERVG